MEQRVTKPVRSSRGLWLALAFALVQLPLAAAAQNVPCPVAAPSPSGPNYLAEVFDLTFCWQAAPGSPTYRIETSTNRGPWIQEAVVSDNHLSLRRGLGDVVRVRMAVCQGSLCSPMSPESKLTFVWPDYDANNDGQITVGDLNLLRSGMTAREMRRFQTIFGRYLVNGRYLKTPPT